MSYFVEETFPPELVFSGNLVATFVCPRCEEKVSVNVDISELRYGIEIECHNEICRAADERAGYIARFTLNCETSFLGYADRPLRALPNNARADKSQRRLL